MTGGVSSWMQQMMNTMHDVEFVIQTLAVKHDDSRTFKYQIPDNVTEIRELYLFDVDYVRRGHHQVKLSKREYQAFKSLFFGLDVDWPCLFDFFYNNQVSVDDLITSADFLSMTREYYDEHFEKAIFSDFIWTLRSMYMPLFMILKNKPVEADVYHSMSTGYSGVYGSMCKYIHKKPLIISEHGIYTREREEEIIKASWVKGLYKDLWINQFHKFSSCAYDFADDVTALFEGAKNYQVELGCPEEKTNVISNGVNLENFENIVIESDPDMVHIGAIVRVTPIKDIKTMINAFSLAKEQVPNIKLWIMGPLTENVDYANKCQQLIKDLALKDIVFTGRINVKDYIGKMDFLLLSSLSEGQPLVILEGFACYKPYISTNVGDCHGMIMGDYDDYGQAGIVVPIMDVERMGQAIIDLATNTEERKEMGLNGYKRAKGRYQNKEVFKRYRDMYQGHARS